ncbi:MAG: peptidase M42, partial [Clostridia bacterium]|nr:peptidase M42 [Clostridia bacterium]
LAEEKGIDHAVDGYPMYSSDCSTALRTFDVKAALIGPGVYASHGYERSHVEGVKNTFALLCAYLGIDE